MGPLNRLATLAIFLLLAFPCLLARVPAQTQPENSAVSLFAQSAVQALNREFPDSNISYLLFDAHSGALLTSRWENKDKPIPLGSLVKPFTALAYARAHDYRYPVYECRGEATGCWRLQPHGKLDIVSAISVSCNSYFRVLAGNVAGAQVLPSRKTFIWSRRTKMSPPQGSLAWAHSGALRQQPWRAPIWKCTAGATNPAYANFCRDCGNRRSAAQERRLAAR
jgi:hypothetical protein